MKRSREAQSPHERSEPSPRQLNMYLLAAGAAGVGALALAQPAECKVVSTPAHLIVNGVGYDLDLNHDGIPDFTILNNSSCDIACNAQVVADRRASSNGVEGMPSFAVALPARARIGPKYAFSGVVMASSTSGVTKGQWVNVADRFLGLKFVIKGETHFGWARFSVRHHGEGYGAFTVALTGYAYETIPGKSILAGQTEATIESSSLHLGNLTPVVPSSRPATLGLLARGALGLVAWRREEEA
jgi:hypothetical protein